MAAIGVHDGRARAAMPTLAGSASKAATTWKPRAGNPP